MAQARLTDACFSEDPLGIGFLGLGLRRLLGQQKRQAREAEREREKLDLRGGLGLGLGLGVLL